MEYAEASKVAIFGVGMYTWNIKNYDPTQAWKDACDFIMPEASMAFRIFCEHNCDPGPNGHQYRREESANYVAPIQTFLTGYKKTRSQSKAQIFWEPYSLKSRLPRA